MYDMYAPRHHEVCFTNEPSEQHRRSVARLLKAQSRLTAKRSDYPDHAAWANDTIASVAADAGKRALLALWDQEPLGVLVYKQDPGDPHRVDARTIAVRAAATAKGLPVAQFLLAMFPHVAADDYPAATTAVCDMKVTNLYMRNLALANGWQPVGTTTLVGPYGHNGVPDLVMQLDLPAATPPAAIL